jgi:hypothetical protein
MRTDIDPVIYMQLMCPSDKDVALKTPFADATTDYGIKDPNIATNPVLPLDESKY